MFQFIIRDCNTGDDTYTPRVVLFF